MIGGKFHENAIGRFYREGGSEQEKKVQFPAVGFMEKLEQLRTGDAVEIARKYRFGRAVAEYLKSNSMEDLDEAGCNLFLMENPDFKDYHPALVRAVAEEITVDNLAGEAREKTKH
jgi:hypothetical protein